MSENNENYEKEKEVINDNKPRRLELDSINNTETITTKREEEKEISETNEINEQNEIKNLDKLDDVQTKEDQQEEEDKQEKEKEDINESNEIEKNKNKKENVQKEEETSRNPSNTINYQISTIETDNSINSVRIRHPNFDMYKDNLIKMSIPIVRNERYNSLKKFDYVFKKRLNEDKNKKLIKLKKENGTNEESIEEIRKLEEPVELTETEIRKYLELYQTEEVEESLQELKEAKKKL